MSRTRLSPGVDYLFTETPPNYDLARQEDGSMVESSRDSLYIQRLDS